MKCRPAVPSRKSDDVLSMLAEAGELVDPTAYEIIYEQCKDEYGNRKPAWRKYCGHRNVFGEKDADGYFRRLYAAQQAFDLQCELQERKAAELKKRAEVYVRRQKMLAQNRALHERNLVRDRTIKAGDRRFHVSPTRQFQQELADDQRKASTTSRALPTVDLRNASPPDAAVTLAALNFNTVTTTSRPSSSVVSHHTSKLHPQQQREPTPEFFSLDFELDGTEYDIDERPDSVACTQTPDTVRPDMYRTAWLRSLRQKHASTQAATFSLASTDTIKPASVGAHLQSFRIPHTARGAAANGSLSARWKGVESSHVVPVAAPAAPQPPPLRPAASRFRRH